jgi:hypothetical protein
MIGKWRNVIYIEQNDRINSLSFPLRMIHKTTTTRMLSLSLSLSLSLNTSSDQRVNERNSISILSMRKSDIIISLQDVKLEIH